MPLALLAAPGLAATKPSPRPKPHCAVPKGWKRVAQNAQLVVIYGKGKGPVALDEYGDAWRYCIRSEGRYRLLVETTPCCFEPSGDPRRYTNSVAELKLAGKYIGYISSVEGRGDGFTSSVSVLLDARRHIATYSDVSDFDSFCAGAPPPAPMLVLSAAGVELFLATATPSPAGCLPGEHVSPFAVLQALTTHAVTLDTASPGEIANLRLYQCSAGCRPREVVAAWTRDAAWHDELVR